MTAAFLEIAHQVLRFLINAVMFSRDFHLVFSYSADPVCHAGMSLHSTYKKYTVLGYPIMDISCSADLTLVTYLCTLHTAYVTTPHLKGTPTTCHLGTESFVKIAPANATLPEQLPIVLP